MEVWADRNGIGEAISLRSYKSEKNPYRNDRERGISQSKQNKSRDGECETKGKTVLSKMDVRKEEAMNQVEKDWKTKVGLRAVCVYVPISGHRCGYVAVPSSHSLFGMGYSDMIENPSERVMSFIKNSPIGKRSPISILIAALDPSCDLEKRIPLDILFSVHGGLTYAASGEKGYPVQNSKDWWFGFDCAHAGDGTLLTTYWPTRTQKYVEKECERLASQIVMLFGNGMEPEEAKENFDGKDSADLLA